eukprot:CAMPEP_0173141068 /NCGR_PEP_ID=MMETSP1105-20130129/5272_1 /TAXON_ID=2985 /ORGANISM="Ochromonas sp., Strain BG-1" /LENGTH=588 /DNA_ID=CAMNT_0014054197 /DNA_START=317 /DNA_END=2082 /DNA_ORIENTATION=-
MDEGFTIIGGGIVVTGPGDVNGDGLADIMVTSYMNWQGNSAALIVPYPQRASPEPTFQPSSAPSQSIALPSSSPSSYPTIRATDPTFEPTVAPSGPTVSPTVSPTSPTISPTAKPTRHPPTIRPTRSPTHRPTRVPSHSPTHKPSSSSPTRSPSATRSVRPTTSPTMKPSTFNPDIRFTANVSQSFSTVYVNITGRYYGTNGLNQIFIIKTSNSSIITGGNGIKRYIIYPIANTTITITDFQITSDIIDLSNFPSTLQQINYKTNPVTILLPNNQKVILSSITSYTLQQDNIIYPDKTTTTTTTSSDSTLSKFSLSTIIHAFPLQAQIIFGILLGLMFISFICCSGTGLCWWNSSDEKGKKKKSKKKQNTKDILLAEKYAMNRRKAVQPPRLELPPLQPTTTITPNSNTMLPITLPPHKPPATTLPTTLPITLITPSTTETAIGAPSKIDPVSSRPRGLAPSLRARLSTNRIAHLHNLPTIPPSVEATFVFRGVSQLTIHEESGESSSASSSSSSVSSSTTNQQPVHSDPWFSSPIDDESEEKSSIPVEEEDDGYDDEIFDTDINSFNSFSSFSLSDSRSVSFEFLDV